MSLYTLKIKETGFKVAVISETKRMKEGLSGKPSLGKNKGMLFDFKKEQVVTMNMKGMNYPLDMVFINSSNEVIAVRTLSPGNFQTTVKGVRFVLEINKDEGSGMIGEKVIFQDELAEVVGIKNEKEDDSLKDSKDEDEDEDEEEENADDEDDKKEVTSKSNLNIIVRISAVPENSEQLFKKGGSFKIYEEEVKSKSNAMQVLDDTGKVLMNIVGGERIFSIEHTEKLVSLSKKVERGEASEEELGQLMKEIIHKQNTQKPEYV